MHHPLCLDTYIRLVKTSLYSFYSLHYYLADHRETHLLVFCSLSKPFKLSCTLFPVTGFFHDQKDNDIVFRRADFVRPSHLVIMYKHTLGLILWNFSAETCPSSKGLVTSLLTCQFYIVSNCLFQSAVTSKINSLPNITFIQKKMFSSSFSFKKKFAKFTQAYNAFLKIKPTTPFFLPFLQLHLFSSSSPPAIFLCF